MRLASRDFRSVLRPVGAVIAGMGAMILLTTAVGSLWNTLSPHGPDHTEDAWQMLGAGLLSIGVGLPIFRYGRRFSRDAMSRREAVLTVTLIWMAAGLFGALPFAFAVDMSLGDAIFESISGLTTTGATVIENIEGRLSRPLLLWRSLIQWLGGMGIVVLFVAVFPSVGAGGKHMFRGEVPGTTAEGLKPRIAETSFALWKLYTLFTLLEIILLTFFGMDAFDALCHSLTTMSTGGFSTLDASVGGFESAPVEYVIATFMILGSVNYGLYYAALRGKDLKVIWRSVEFKAFLGIVGLSILWLFAFNLDAGEDVEEGFRDAYFMVATTISSTGYGTHDYGEYSSPAMSLFVILMFVGGCSGSTAGGIKVERFVLMAKQALSQVKKSYRPAAVELIRMGRSVVKAPVIADVMAFVVIYMCVMGAGVLFVTVVEGIGMPAAFGAMLTCLSNMGPAPFHESAADNFAHYSTLSKLFFCLAMLLGRLEFFTLLALCVPSFWRR